MPPRTKAAFLFVGLLACARAQSVESIPIRARLSSTIPGGTANGSVTIRLRVVRNAAGNIVDGSAVLALRYRFASAVTLTGVRILRGSGVALAEGLSESDPTGQGGVSRTFPLDRAGVEALLLPGRLALEVATSDSPEGALRGPLEMADEAILLGQLGTGTPPRGGLATIRLMATRDPRGRLTSAEIRWRITAGGPHVGSVRLASGADSIQLAGPESTNVLEGFEYASEVPMSPASAGVITALLRSPERVTLQLAGADGTSFAGPLHGTDHATFHVRSRSGVMRLDIHLLRDGAGRASAASIAIDPPPGSRPLAATLSGQGLSLPVPLFPGTGAIAEVTGPEGLAFVNQLLAAPEDFAIDYLGQTPLAARRGAPMAQTILSAVWDPAHRAIAPGGLFTIFGRDLAMVAGNLAGLVGPRVPAALNGTSVLMGGRAVPLLDVEEGRVIAQVPYDLAPGVHPVTVRTTAGQSLPLSAEVSATAPAVFFADAGPQGNIVAVYKDDGSLVSVQNPARPGETLRFFASGFGARTVPEQPNDLVASSLPLARTALPTVMIGGRPAPVVYSVLAPGLLGIAQTAVRMPQNAGAGNLPLIVSVGGVRANAVILFTAVR